MAKHFMAAKDLAHMPSDYVEPLQMSAADFPASQLSPQGMQHLSIDLNNYYPKVKLGVPYAVKDGEILHLQIIVPALQNDQQTFPLLMWVQGSAFHKQDLGDRMAPMMEIAKHGYVVAMVEYRHAPEHAFPVQVRDLNTATRFMLDHAQQYHVDPTKYVACGDSSGGHTVTLASVTEDQPFFSDEDIHTRPLSFKACIDLYGPTDISRMNKVPSTQDHVTAHSLEGEFFGTKNIYDHPELVQKANPIAYIRNDHAIPPFLIMHGNKDRLVPFEQSCLLYQALRDHDKTVYFYQIENSDHATDAFYRPEALRIILNFLAQY
ncbi:alpha/beta hydrolase [Limosilactobacillus caecicola]|uniref:alpha/beta hydrolase n=1 Tax=Limosilactobacillus caecicola TaxID=2941332 RepID=UPI00203DF4ED|nr:alpha/beta hydrolase [Limosilactobacillus caecicola]